MTAEDLRKSILQQAIQGKLVPQDPTDEPASVLLARIREEKARLVKEKKIKKDKNESLIYRGDDNSYYEKFADGTVKCIDEEIPFEIPQGWEWARLSAICILLSRGKSPKYTEEKIYPVFAQKCNLKEGGISLEQARFLDPTTLHKWGEEFKLRTGDVLVNSTGTGTVCRTRLFDEKYLGDYPFVVPDSHISVVRTHDEIESSFVCDYISSAKTQQYLEGNLAGTTNQKELYIGVLANLLIPIPPTSEQKRIVCRIEELLQVVSRFSGLKNNLDKLESSIRPLLKKSILQYAIQGKLVPQNPEDEPASELLKRIEEEKVRLVKAGKIKRDKNASVIFKGEDNKYYEKLGSKVSDITDDIPFDIPDSWQWCRLSTLANLYTGNSINESDKKKYYTYVEGLEYIATKDLSFEGRFCYKNGVAIPESHLSEFRIAPKGAVLMCIEGGSAGRKVGQLEQDVCFGNKLCCFAPYADISEYILYYLQSPIFYDIFTSSKSGIIGGVSVNNLKQLLVPLPPYSEIRRIVPAIRKVLKSIEG